MKTKFIYVIVQFKTVRGYKRTIMEAFGWFKTQEDCQSVCDKLKEYGYRYEPRMICPNDMYLPNI